MQSDQDRWHEVQKRKLVAASVSLFQVCYLSQHGGLPGTHTITASMVVHTPSTLSCGCPHQNVINSPKGYSHTRQSVEALPLRVWRVVTFWIFRLSLSPSSSRPTVPGLCPLQPSSVFLLPCHGVCTVFYFHFSFLSDPPRRCSAFTKVRSLAVGQSKTCNKN